MRNGKSGPPLQAFSILYNTEYVSPPIDNSYRHIHLRQNEYFEVQEGVLGVFKDEQEYAITKNGPCVVIPTGTRQAAIRLIQSQRLSTKSIRQVIQECLSI